ncbi:hypothetical protein RB653_006929 [Dictyostelium firmibasis]|uniref:J domain-containing protein n=1 Tax=Dictyostelium firmibasis TaxID=79012 RepID=A0AAN7YX44_9MYCE
MTEFKINSIMIISILILMISQIIIVVESKTSLYYSILGDYEKGIDYYKVLNVSKESTYSEIKKSFRKLSLKHHPDRNAEKSSHHLYILLNQAHSVLTSDESRKEYDDLLENGIPWHENYYGKYAYRYTGISHDIRHVLFGLIIVITIAKFIYQWNKHHSMIKRAKQTDQYKKRLAQLDGDEDEIQLVIQDAEKPTFSNLFIIQLFIIFPFTILKSLYTFIFINKFKIIPKTDQEKEEEYRIKMGYTKEDWEYHKKKSIERMEKFKQSGKYKQYLRSKNK